MANNSENLDRIRSEIISAARTASRKVEDVNLIAVSKTRTAAEISRMIDAGQRLFGENRVQEAAEKWPALRAANPDIELHLIGQLQSNKADDAVKLFDVIHSVDRPSLVAALAVAMASQNRHLPCFIQVNIGAEEQKGGVAITELPHLLQLARKAGLNIIGLMCIPPADLEPAPYFALLAELAARHGLKQLSMGMSGDFATAIQLGATYIRVGTALFGERHI